MSSWIAISIPVFLLLFIFFTAFLSKNKYLTKNSSGNVDKKADRNKQNSVQSPDKGRTKLKGKTTDTVKYSIAGSRIVVGNSLLGSVSRGVISPPDDLTQNIENELVSDGYIEAGDFIRYVDKNGYGEPVFVEERPSNETVSEMGPNLFSNLIYDIWLCCRRYTDSSSYDVFVALTR